MNTSGLPLTPVWLSPTAFYDQFLTPSELLSTIYLPMISLSLGLHIICLGVCPILRFQALSYVCSCAFFIFSLLESFQWLFVSYQTFCRHWISLPSFISSIHHPPNTYPINWPMTVVEWSRSLCFILYRSSLLAHIFHPLIIVSSSISLLRATFTFMEHSLHSP